MTDAGMTMQELVLQMPMPNYAYSTRIVLSDQKGAPYNTTNTVRAIGYMGRNYQKSLARFARVFYIVDRRYLPTS
jgi:hypothetical protein